ncbi:MAG: ribonuclease [Erythrobacter sp. SCN 62-14]|nr:MAG: ribonuclease [Erythrobacter sp. SCN 62-14]
MAEWLVEQGIGETRSLLVEGDTVLAATLAWNGELTAGTPVTGQLVSKHKGSKRGVVRLDTNPFTGLEVLVDHLPPDVTEGARLALTITRAAIAERGRFKCAQGRVGVVTTPESAQGRPVQHFPAGLWEEVWHAASCGSIAFVGGEILVSVTPAMTVIDIDGSAAPRELALAAIPAIAQALRWFDLGGNIAIDFPTLQAKADRRAVDEALGEALDGWPHECTAMNGFGLVQLVARAEGPSLLHRFATSRVGMCARYALRQAERAEGTGRTLLLTVHPALKAKLREEWLTELARRTGRAVRLETSPALALEAPSAQIIT